MQPSDSPRVLAVARDDAHRFSKPVREAITLLAGLGVEGDAHLGTTVQHLSRKRRDPDAPNLRQVHLVHAELHEELAEKGFDVGPGDLGENVTTAGVPLLDLPTGTRLHLGEDAVVELTGLRNPCIQIDTLGTGAMKAVLDRDADGNVVRKSGVMGVVIAGGDVRPEDAVRVELPAGERRALQPV
ncbi:MOSC domain-containing protein YiiM [Clavibacter michiganensis]|uniref:MOSC domain-containing protein n=1 Tax=Clavibacter michiganensis TaxID=28447 RepID=UPI001AEA44CF|nr:MOSC domain-containing protein [Clavibacter michiganensis]MBP2457629.1 MOSC domain-containing protein YiiM [Clavibacter michiganensis]MDQ0410199.1 MOSC domain-containing protein YiiM [Clavibacter michiganensis]